MTAAELPTGWFLDNAWLIPVIPGAAFWFIILFGKRLPMKGAELGLASLGASLVLAAGTTYQWVQRVDAASGGEEHAGGPFGMLRAIGRSVAASESGEEAAYVAPVIRSWTWWQNDGLTLSIGQHIDGLAVVLLLVVAFISLLVQVFSLEYVRGDRRYTHFFAAMTLFSAGMLVMVLAENMIQVILGWEIMGLCSFMLIGHWWEEEPNARAALKAFLTVRVGDVGLLVGTAILFFGANAWSQEHLGTSGFSIQGISGWALSGDGSHTVLLWAGIALFIGCIGKSGQFPLHTWLPDAMAGPTPVSSLLHSSTMVVAGVFLVARLYPVFWEAFSIPEVSVNFIVVIAAITIIISGVLAFVQNDIKKVLAYSTVGQLGYMMLGLGAGAWLPAVFHIFTHAFFKCCLFLCAGSVSHSGSHHSFDMKQDMGGLAKKMPITATCWIISALALAGIFPLAGFFSKDEIIDNVGHNGYEVFMYIALVGAFMTAAYTARATYLTFFGQPRGAAAYDDHGHVDDHALGASLAAHDAPALQVQQEGELEAADAHGEAGAVAVALEEEADPALTDHGHDAHGHDDHHAEHHPPRESPKLILIPIVILAGIAAVVGFANATPFGEEWENFKKYVEPVPVAVATVEGAVVEEAAAIEPAGEEAGAEGGEEAGRGGEPRHRLRPRDPGGERGLLLPGHQPRRVQVVQGARVARHGGRRAAHRLGRLRGAVHPSGPPARRAHRTVVGAALRLPVRGEQVLPGLAVRDRDRPGHRPPDREGGQLGQPERHRRCRQRRRPRREARRSVHLPQRRPTGRRRRGQRLRDRRQRHRLGPATRPVRQGRPVRRPALRRGGRRRRRARDRQRVRIRIAWTS